MSRIFLTATLTLLTALPVLAQSPDEGLPLDSRPSIVTGEQILSGRKTWAQSKTWLVTPDGRRYHLPSARRNEERMKMAHGWLDDRQIEIRATVSNKNGILTASVVELLDPVVSDLRVTVQEEGGTFYLSSGDQRLQVRDEFTGPGLVRPLVGSTIDVRAFVFQDGTTLVRAVKARALKWHFQPIVVTTPLIIPRWKGPGTEYWVTLREQGDKVMVGVRHLDASDLDFLAPVADAAGTEQQPQAGIKDALGRSLGAGD